MRSLLRCRLYVDSTIPVLVAYSQLLFASPLAGSPIPNLRQLDLVHINVDIGRLSLPLDALISRLKSLRCTAVAFQRCFRLGRRHFVAQFSLIHQLYSGRTTSLSTVQGADVLVRLTMIWFPITPLLCSKITPSKQ